MVRTRHSGRCVKPVTVSTSDDEVGPWPCTVCEKGVVDGLQCEWCDSWSHFECVKLKGQDVVSLMAHENVMFVCEECSDFHEAMKVGIKAFRKKPESERSDVMEEVVNFMSAAVSERNEIAKVGNNKDKDGSSYAEVLKKDLCEMKNDVAELKRFMSKNMSVVGDALLESREKERRETNVILHQLPESTDMTDATDMADAKKHDIKLVKEVFKGLGLDNIELLRVFRLGPKHPEGKPRLLLVDVGSKDKRDVILRRAPNLKKVESLSKVYICEDRTPAEQEMMRKLIKEKNEKANQDPEHFYIIRNFRIVCLQRHAGTGAMGVMGSGPTPVAS